MQAVFKIWLIFITVMSVFAEEDAGTTNNETFRIIGGDLVEPGEFSFVVGLKIHLNKPGGVSLCTGTVLDQHTVLTAGHCLVDSRVITIYVNCTDLRGCTNTRTGTGFVHPDYGKVYGYTVNDIGLVKTKQAIGTKEVMLQKPAQKYSLCVAVGYGATSKNPKPVINTLLYKVTIKHLVRCNTIFRRITEYESNLCAFVKGGKQTYKGDSGGPLLCNSKQVGITSGLVTGGDREDVSVWFIPYSNTDFINGCANFNFTSLLVLGSILLCVPMLS